MRYSSAFVLSTMAAGQATAHSIRHASFHARRQIDYNDPNLYDKVDWNSALKSVDWDGVFNPQKPSATPTPEAKVEAKVETAPVPTPAPAKAEAPTVSDDSSPSDLLDTVGDFVDGLLDGIASWVEEVGIGSVGVNSKDANGHIWLGKSQYSAEFTNAGSQDVMLVCWADQDYGFTVNVKQPAITVKIPQGKTQAISFGAKVPAACTPVYPGRKIAQFGGFANTWAELNLGPHSSDYSGAFDVSKNPNMDGDIIEMHGSKCKSTMDTCFFQCKNPDPVTNSCTYDYELVNCDASNGGGSGYDVKMAGVGGGCSIGAEGEVLQVTLKNRS